MRARSTLIPPSPTDFIGSTSTDDIKWEPGGDFYQGEGEDEDGKELSILWTIQNPGARGGAGDWDKPT